MIEKKEEKSSLPPSQAQTKFFKFFGRYYRLITVGAIVLLAVISYYILVPKYEEIKSGGNYNLDTLTNTKQERQDYLDSLETLVNNYQNINQVDVEKIKQILPGQKDIAGLFVQLQALAAKNGFAVSSINISPDLDKKSPGSDSGIKRLNISLNLIGSVDGYQGLKQFLDSLENNLRLIDVNAVYFSPNSANYSLNLFTYYLVSE